MMFSKNINLRKFIFEISIMFLFVIGAVVCMALLVPSSVKAASEIKIIVNKKAITTTDIQRRTALLRLQQRKGKIAQEVRKQLIEEALKLQEMERLRAVPSNAEINATYSRIASGNNLSAKQMNDILVEANVMPKHFKHFLRVQIGWQRVVAARFGNKRKISTQDLVSKMLERGDDKPTTTEYILQQIIFVVPSAKRNQSTLKRRTTEAKRFRAKVGACDTNKERTKELKDVTVRNLGRFLKPELPPEWAPLIFKTDDNKPTSTLTTEKGVEFLVICKSRDVSDDVAAEILFRSEELQSGKMTENEKKYLNELRRRAVIADR